MISIDTEQRIKEFITEEMLSTDSAVFYVKDGVVTMGDFPSAGSIETLMSDVGMLETTLEQKRESLSCIKKDLQEARTIINDSINKLTEEQY